MRWWLPVLAAVLLVGCAPAAPDSAGTPSVRPRGEPASSAVRDLAFPADTLQDWVTYADRVVVVRIDSEARREPTPEEVRLGRRSTHRMVTWTRQAVLWANPARPAEDAPSTMTTYGGSWSSQRDNAHPETFGGEPALFVGHTYLAALTHTALGPGAEREWIDLMVLPFDDGLVGDGERFRGWQGQEELLDAVWGKTGDEVAELLRLTPIDPEARPFAGEDAAPKYQHAAR